MRPLLNNTLGTFCRRCGRAMLSHTTYHPYCGDICKRKAHGQAIARGKEKVKLQHAQWSRIMRDTLNGDTQ